MTYDAIDHLKGFEYAEREAAFLYMVAVHSGYFLRRQFNQFVARERGAIATHFLLHAASLGHIEEMPCADGRIIYHLANKQIYAMAGNAGSQGRRIKSSREILRRLIALDYVMKHLAHDHFIESSDERGQLFSQLKISSAVIKGTEVFERIVRRAQSPSATNLKGIMLHGQVVYASEIGRALFVANAVGDGLESGGYSRRTPAGALDG
jgi:hypothetical protein